MSITGNEQKDKGGKQAQGLIVFGCEIVYIITRSRMVFFQFFSYFAE